MLATERTGKPGRPMSPETAAIRGVLRLKPGEQMPRRFRDKTILEVIELVKNPPPTLAVAPAAIPATEAAPKPPTTAKASHKRRRRGRTAKAKTVATTGSPSHVAHVELKAKAIAGEKMTLVTRLQVMSQVGSGFIVEEKPLEYNTAHLATRERLTIQAGKETHSLAPVTIDAISLVNGKEFWVLVGKLAAPKKAEPEAAPIAVEPTKVEETIAPPPPIA